MQVYDIVQILPNNSVNKEFWGLLFEVDEVHSWGVVATHRTIGKIYPLRIPNKAFRTVGKLIVIVRVK